MSDTTTTATPSKKSKKVTGAKKRQPRAPKPPEKFLVEMTRDQIDDLGKINNALDEFFYSLGVNVYDPKIKKDKNNKLARIVNNVTDAANEAEDAIYNQTDLRNRHLNTQLKERAREALDAVSQVIDPPKKLDSDADKAAALEHAKHCLEEMRDRLDGTRW
jgi:hypothetical protein